MEKSYVIQTLRLHEPELRAAGIVHLRLFGSVARGEASAESDVDLMADIDRSKRLKLFSLAGLENRLSDLLGVKVDLSPADSMKEVMTQHFLQLSDLFAYGALCQVELFGGASKTQMTSRRFEALKGCHGGS